MPWTRVTKWPARLTKHLLPISHCNICEHERSFSFAAIFHFAGCLLPSLRSFLLLLSFTRRNNESLLLTFFLSRSVFFHTFQLPCGKCPIQRKLGMAVIITSRPSWVITLWQERQWWQVRAAGLRVSANKEGKKEEERRFSWGEETWKAPRTTYLSEFKYENKQIPWQISCFFSIIFVKM